MLSSFWCQENPKTFLKTCLDGSALSSSDGHHQGCSWGGPESTLTTGVKTGGSSCSVQEFVGNAAGMSRDMSPALLLLCLSGLKRMQGRTAHKRDNS